VEQGVLIVEVLLEVILAGAVGTAAMTLLMSFVTKAGLANADMVRAIGSVFTGSLERALLVGATLYTTGGFVFAMLYTIALSLLPVEGFWPIFGFSTLFGFVHGFLVSFFLVVLVAEHHPIERFREAGFGVALAHLLGHVVYGMGVGVVLGTLGLGFG
jgi:hypothetical protein